MSGKTPEARLLELIKGPPSRGARRSAVAARDLLSRFASSVRRRGPGLSVRRAANGALSLLLAVLAARTLAVFARPSSSGGVVEAAALGVPEAAPAPETATLRDLTRRNLFRPAAPPPEPVVAAAPRPAEPPPPPPVPLSRRAAQWRLVGIIEGDEGLQAVMEDSGRGASRYVSAGDSLDDIRVEKVMADRVVLLYLEETLELRL